MSPHRLRGRDQFVLLFRIYVALNNFKWLRNNDCSDCCLSLFLIAAAAAAVVVTHGRSTNTPAQPIWLEQSAVLCILFQTSGAGPSLVWLNSGTPFLRYAERIQRVN